MVVGVQSEVLKIDIDAEDFDHRAMLKMLELHFNYNTRFFKTKNGVHVVVFDLPSLEPLRMMYCDDPKRLECDRHRHVTNVLYSIKVTKDEVSMEEEVTIWEAIDHLNELKKKLRRVRRVKK